MEPHKPNAAIEQGPAAQPDHPTASVAARDEKAKKQGGKMRGAFKSILYAAALTCLPILAISGLLLALILSHRTHPLGGCSFELPDSKSATWLKNEWDVWQVFGGKEAYLVQYEATTLTTIAQWTGKLVPYLSSSIMALVAFFTSFRILELSRKGSEAKLPTPHQLTILIGLLDGKGKSWRDYVKISFQRKQKILEPLPSTFIALTVLNLLGLLIPAIDTWFGISTTTVQCIQLIDQEQPRLAYGRGLIPACWSQPILDDYYGPCSVGDADDPDQAYLFDPKHEAFQTYFGLSGLHQVQSYIHAQYGTIYLLTDHSMTSSIDAEVQTYGLTTQCSLLDSCGAGPSPLGGDFQCTSAFKANWTWSGAVGTPDEDSGFSESSKYTGILFFEDAKLTKAIGDYEFDMLYAPLNPFFFGTWALNYPEYGAQWILQCKSTVLQAKYTWTSGSISSLNVEHANTSLGAIVYAPFAIGLAKIPLSDMADLVGTLYYDGNEYGKLAEAFANLFSHAAISLASSVMSPRTNLLEQHREPLQLARVPKVPLFILLGLKLFYVLTTLTLAIAALALTSRSETLEVKERLSVEGLAAACFEPSDQKNSAVRSMEELFAENHESSGPTTKVGVVKNEKGGWEYVALAGGLLIGLSDLVKPWTDPVLERIV